MDNPQEIGRMTGKTSNQILKTKLKPECLKTLNKYCSYNIMLLVPNTQNTLERTQGAFPDWCFSLIKR